MSLGQARPGLLASGCSEWHAWKTLPKHGSGQVRVYDVWTLHCPVTFLPPPAPRLVLSMRKSRVGRLCLWNPFSAAVWDRKSSHQGSGSRPRPRQAGTGLRKWTDSPERQQWRRSRELALRAEATGDPVTRGLPGAPRFPFPLRLTGPRKPHRNCSKPFAHSSSTLKPFPSCGWCPGAGQQAEGQDLAGAAPRSPCGLGPAVPATPGALAGVGSRTPSASRDSEGLGGGAHVRLPRLDSGAEAEDTRSWPATHRRGPRWASSVCRRTRPRIRSRELTTR